MKVSAKKRQQQGTGASRRLRNAGVTPGIVYGGNKEAIAIELDHNKLWHAAQKEAFHTSILDLEISSSKEKVLLRDVQYHPWKRQILHVDFMRVLADQEITVVVPIHFAGEADSPAVKLGGNVVNYVVAEVEIVCLPADLPEFVKVDLSKLESESVVHASAIELPKGVNFAPNFDLEAVIVTASAPSASQGEEESDVDAEVAEEVEQLEETETASE